MRPRRGVVLGGTGFIGASAAVALAAAGDEVTVVARRAPLGEVAASLGSCDVVLGDVEQAGVAEEVLRGADYVVHAVGRSLPAESTAHPVLDAATALTSLLRTLEALRSRPAVEVYYLSSGGAIYGNVEVLPASELARCRPISSYGVMKLAAEHYLDMYRVLYGVRSTSIRIANAYGPGQPVRPSQGFVAATFDALRRDAPLRIYGDGSSVRDYVYIDDIARAIVGIVLADEPPSVVNVASGVGISVNDVLEMVASLAGSAPRREYLAARPGDVQAIVLDTKLLTRVLPWHPLPLLEGLERTWRHLETAAAGSRSA